jgi:hypothetical protein
VEANAQLVRQAKAGMENSVAEAIVRIADAG